MKHLNANIEGLLRLTDTDLGNFLVCSGKKARKELLKLQAKGDVYIGSDECKGFDPVTGCPGHEDEIKEAA